MAPVVQPTVPEQLAKERGIKLIDGHWEPTRLIEQQDQLSAKQKTDAQARKNQQKGIFLVILFATLIIGPILIIVLPNDAFFLCGIFFSMVFFILIIWASYSAKDASPSPNNAMGFYPTVDVGNGYVFLDRVPVDYSRVALCQVDRVMDEFRIIETDGRRKMIFIRYYEDPNRLVAALEAAFQVHGIRIDERQDNYGAPVATVPIAQGQSMTDRTEANIEQKKKNVEAQMAMREEHRRQQEERIASKGPEIPIPPVTRPAGPMPSAGPTCKKCGAALSDDLIECPRCGTPI